MKQYQNWLAQYMKCRREGDHALAAELASLICGFWLSHGNDAELKKWQKLQDEHAQQVALT